jgi:hypothetical protein
MPDNHSFGISIMYPRRSNQEIETGPCNSQAMEDQTGLIITLPTQDGGNCSDTGASSWSMSKTTRSLTSEVTKTEKAKKYGLGRKMVDSIKDGLSNTLIK